FAACEFRQPALLLLLGAVMENVRSDDARMQRRTERVEAGKRKLPIDDGFVRKAAAGPAILLRHCGAQQPGGAGFGPDLARIEMILVPFLQMRRVFGGDETARSLFQKDDVLAHPGGPRQIENVGHVGSSPSWGHRRSMTTLPDLGKRTGAVC